MLMRGHYPAHSISLYEKMVVTYLCRFGAFIGQMRAVESVMTNVTTSYQL